MQSDHAKVTRRYHGRDNNVLVESPKSARLACGHHVVAHPIALLPNGKGFFECPEGCGLQKQTGP